MVGRGTRSRTAARKRKRGSMRVALFMGGRSGEHAVSLRSGAAVAGALEKLGHVRFEVVIEREAGARWPGGAGGVGAALAAVEAFAPDVAFIAMHGPDGEDGRIQGALELLGVPYQGSGVQASANGLDKIRTKAIFRQAGLPLAGDRALVASAPPDWAELAAALGLPLVLKTRASGSSVGVEVVRDVAALAARGAALLADNGALLVEEHLSGREFSGPVVEDEDGTPRALPVIEIRPRAAAFFDYEAKYTPGATDEICPAEVPGALESELRELALRAHVALGCRGYSRTDIMLASDGAPRILETNTLPGLTPESLLPRAATVAGLTFSGLVERLLLRALQP